MSSYDNEMELLSGVLDALPCPAALLDEELQPAYVNDRACPISFDEVNFAELLETQTALTGAAQAAVRVRLTAGNQGCFGQLEVYPVSAYGRITGVLVMFRPEFTAGETTFDTLPVRSAAMEMIWRKLQRYALLASPLLLVAEPGLGRQDFACALHKSGLRRDKPLVTADAQADGFALAELVRQSGDGTLLCADLERWPREEIERLRELMEDRALTDAQGLRVPRHCRVIATASPDWVGEGCEQSAALADYLSDLTVELPPLRERPEDIMPAAHAFLRQCARSGDVGLEGFSVEAQEILRHYSWPGNLEQLREAVTRTAQTCPGGLALASHLPIGGADIRPGAGRHLHAMRQVYMREQIRALLDEYGDSVSAKKRAAAELGIGLSTLYRLLAEK